MGTALKTNHESSVSGGIIDSQTFCAFHGEPDHHSIHLRQSSRDVIVEVTLRKFVNFKQSVHGLSNSARYRS